MDPDVTAAVADLRRRGTLTADQAALFSRVARRELVSVHAELRALAYAGVLLVMAGVGLLVEQNLDRIGPLAIAVGLASGAIVCLAWVAHEAAPFTRDAVPSPHLALDYVLLLGALLAGAFLAYVEAKFTPLGPAWPWHLLIAAVFYAALAFRCDSRVLLSLALSTFAAWRGVSAGRLQDVWTASQDVVRANAAACGLLFLLLGATLRRRRFKPHFEPVAVHLGWLLLLGAVASAIDTSAGSLYALVLIALSGVLAAIGYLQRRFSLMAIAILSAYVGLTALVVRATHDEAIVLWFLALTPLLMIALLFVAHRHLREPE